MYNAGYMSPSEDLGLERSICQYYDVQCLNVHREPVISAIVNTNQRGEVPWIFGIQESQES